MSFSKEDKAAWLDSEIMKELEKIAEKENILEGPPPEAFEPLSLKEEEKEEEKEEKVWEEEEVAERFDEAVEEFSEPTLKDELRTAYDKLLLENLEKIASELANSKNVKAAYRVEMTLHGLQDLFKEENND
jgi:hypothetical protein